MPMLSIRSATGVFVGVKVGVLVGVLVAVGVAVGVLVGVKVGVLVGVKVLVGVGVVVFVAVLVDVAVAVGVKVGVLVGVKVLVGVVVAVFVAVLVGVAVAVGVKVGVSVGVVVAVFVAVLVGVFVGVKVLVGVAVGGGGTNSYAPMSQPPDGRLTPRWSVVIGLPLVNSGLLPLLTYTQLPPGTPASMALLPLSSAKVWVGPPFEASVAAMFVTGLADRPQLPSARSFALVNVPKSLQSAPVSFVKILLLSVTAPLSRIAPPEPPDELPEKVLLAMFSVPLLKIAPPPKPPAELPEKVLLATFSVPAMLEIAPPP
jgi:hypothetical protein